MKADEVSGLQSHIYSEPSLGSGGAWPDQIIKEGCCCTQKWEAWRQTKKNMTNEVTTIEPEIVSADSVLAIERAQIDTQIATARKYPRTLSSVKSQMLSFACLDEDTAAACFYTLPRGGKTIQGPSVRLAEIAVSSYQNLKAGSRVLTVTPTGDTPHVVVQAVCHDLQNNVCISVEKRRRITSKKNRDGTRRPVDEDDIQLAANAASAIAFRDAVFKVIPGALIRPVFDAAKKVAVGEVKSLAERRGKVVDRLKQMGATLERILAVVECQKVEDITTDKLEVLVGLGTALKDGEITVEDAFPLAVNEAKPIFRKESHDPAPPKQDPLPAPASTENDSAPAPQADPTTTPQQELSAIVTGAGFTFEQFVQFADKMSLLDGPVTQWSEISDANAKRCISAKAGMLRALKGAAK